MRTPEYHGPFKKDRKLMTKQNKDMDKLNEVMDLLLKSDFLPHWLSFRIVRLT